MSQPSELGIHDPHLFEGLRALAKTAFPKRCNNCGQLYDSEQDFITRTQGVWGKSGLKASVDDDGAPIVELFRNCVCGSTLLDFFNDRRDLSERGQSRRDTFEGLLVYLEARGLERKTAREELLRVLKGEKSERLAKLKSLVADKPPPTP
jgi:hypothetical protein